jgi:integrase
VTLGDALSAKSLMEMIYREHLPAHLKDPVTFLYHSGWRTSEMRKLEWRDVELAGKGGKASARNQQE